MNPMTELQQTTQDDLEAAIAVLADAEMRLSDTSWLPWGAQTIERQIAEIRVVTCRNRVDELTSRLRIYKELNL